MPPPLGLTRLDRETRRRLSYLHFHLHFVIVERSDGTSSIHWRDVCAACSARRVRYGMEAASRALSQIDFGALAERGTAPGLDDEAPPPGWTTTTRLARMATTRKGPIDRPAVYERDAGICHLCGRPVDPRDFHLDHVIPLVDGGPHTADNLKVAHPVCNRQKEADRVDAARAERDELRDRAIAALLAARRQAERGRLVAKAGEATLR